jgi:aryl-alcohol dehydrogenase-like predicted oxidoreductase
MQKRELGRSGLKVLAMALGCMVRFDSHGSRDDGESNATSAFVPNRLRSR